MNGIRCWANSQTATVKNKQPVMNGEWTIVPDQFLKFLMYYWVFPFVTGNLLFADTNLMQHIGADEPLIKNLTELF